MQLRSSNSNSAPRRRSSSSSDSSFSGDNEARRDDNENDDINIDDINFEPGGGTSYEGQANPGRAAGRPGSFWKVLLGVVAFIFVIAWVYSSSGSDNTRTSSPSSPMTPPNNNPQQPQGIDKRDDDEYFDRNHDNTQEGANNENPTDDDYDQENEQDKPGQKDGTDGDDTEKGANNENPTYDDDDQQENEPEKPAQKDETNDDDTEKSTNNENTTDDDNDQQSEHAESGDKHAEGSDNGNPTNDNQATEEPNHPGEEDDGNETKTKDPEDSGETANGGKMQDEGTTENDHYPHRERTPGSFDLTVQYNWNWAKFPKNTDDVNKFCEDAKVKSRDLIGRIRQNRNLPMGMVLGVDSLIGVLGNSSSLLNLLSNVHPLAEVRKASQTCIQALQKEESKMRSDVVLVLRLYEEYERLNVSTMKNPVVSWDSAPRIIRQTAQPNLDGQPPFINSWSDDTVRLWLAARFIRESLKEARTMAIDVEDLAKSGINADLLLKCETNLTTLKCPSAAKGVVKKMKSFQQLSNRASEISNKFETAIAESQQMLVVQADDVEKKCAGLPEDFVEARRVKNLENVNREELPSAGDDDVLLTTSYPDVLPVLKFGRYRNLRRRLYVIFNSRAYPENTQRLSNLLLSRRNISELLEFPNWSSLMQEQMMAQSPEAVNKFLEEVHTLVRQTNKNELLRQLQDLLREDEGENKTLEPYDLTFYMEKLRKKLLESNYDTRSYFNVDQAHAGLLSVTSDLFNVVFEVVLESPTFTRVDKILGDNDEDINNKVFYRKVSDRAAADRWHDDVEVLNVYAKRDPPQKQLLQKEQQASMFSSIANKTGILRLSTTCPDNGVQRQGCWRRYGDLLARIYLDFYPRSGKFSHAAMFPLKMGRTGDGAPEFALVCNFPKHGAMELSQVTTMFHEFGHGIHYIFAGVNKRLYGLSGLAVPGDFVEVPSQVYERWVNEANTLKKISSHEETKEPMSEEVLSKIKEEDRMQRANSIESQIFYSMISLKLHEVDNQSLPLFPNNPNASIQTIENFVDGLRKKYTAFSRVPGTHPEASFGHLSGYSSIYYSYLWSDVIVEDIVSHFRSTTSGLWNTTTIRRYVDTILSQGGEIDANDQLVLFLGRNYSMKPFKEELQAGSETLSRRLQPMTRKQTQ